MLLVTGGYGLSPQTPDLVPVSNGAGEIVAVGDGVIPWQAGDHVAGIFSHRCQGGAQVSDA